MNPESDRRLTGNQIVAVVFALSAAVILAPVGVYAAAVQKVAIADAQNPRLTANVDRNGRITASVTGRVGGRMESVPRPPAEPFHRGQLVSPSTPTLGAQIPKGKSLAITSVSTVYDLSMTTSDGRQGVRLVVRKADSSGICPATGPVHGVVLHVIPMPGEESGNVERTFPTPQVWRATASALCLQHDSGVAGIPVVVDGYLF